MRIVGIQGLRGGVGTTSIVAMLADALHASGQSVLMVDLNSSDMLRLHFNVPFLDKTGWAYAQHLGQPWHTHSLEITPGLGLIPFGRLGLYRHTDAAPNPALQFPTDLNWLAELKKLRSPPHWVLLDLPHSLLLDASLQQLLNLHLIITSVDASCHILLSQQFLPPGTKVLTNMQDPTRSLSSDLMIEWQTRFQHLLAPLIINRDESVHEALAQKTPVTKAFPNSRAAADARALASWIQLHTRDRA